jgi:competence protein ComEC
MQAEDSSFGQTRPAFAGLGAVPLFHAAWLFAAGVTLSHWLWLRPSLVLVALALVAVLCGVAALYAQRVAWLPLAMLWCLLGAWCAEMEPHPAPAPDVAALSDGLLRTVEGTVVNTGPMRGELEQNVAEDSEWASAAPQAPPQSPAQSPSQRIDLQVSTLEVVTDDQDAQLPATGGVRLTIRWPLDQKLVQSNPQPFHCGERIRAEARLLRPETYHDPDVFSRADFLLDQGITSTASLKIDRVERLGTAPGAFLACRVAGLQHASSARLLALPAAMRHLPAPLRLTQDDAIMLAAMVTGDRTYLTHSIRVGFERTGSFHMLVVSGFHLAIVAGCLFWFAKKLRLPRVPATFVTILASFGYALFTGFATPVQRSLWMVTLYMLGRLLYRERSPLNTIGFASLCLMAVSPRSLFESSLQMTLLAVVSIAGVAVPLLQATIHPYLTATRDLSLVAIDSKLAPRLAQFRVTLRMIAARLQKAIAPRRRTPSKAPQLPASDDKQNPQLTLLSDAASVSTATSHAVAHSRFAKSISWRFFPWAIRFALRIGELLVVSCVVELAMALPMAIYFHRITVFALPVNVFILPLLAVLMPAALVTLLALLVWPAAAVIPAAVVALMLHLGVGLVHLFGSLAWGDFRIPSPLLVQSAAFCALLAAAILLAHLAVSTESRWPHRAAWLALVGAALAAVAPRPIQHPANALLVEAIDVGQGDSLLLITPDGKTLLVDGGGFGGGPHQAPQDFDIGEDVVSEALWSRGIRHLDAVALSHAHSDHMGGLPAVLRNFHPAELWVGNNPRVGAYNALLDEAAALHVQLRSFRSGDAFPLGRAQVSVLAPFPSYQPESEPGNNDSLVLHVAYGATSVLLEGDAEAPIEQAMLSEPGLPSTLLKVGHHGSLTSTRPEFLARVAPQWAVISCGLRNRFGHPREEILEELQAAHVRTYRTDINGASCFRLDGKSAAPEPFCGEQH